MKEESTLPDSVLGFQRKKSAGSSIFFSFREEPDEFVALMIGVNRDEHFEVFDCCSMVSKTQFYTLLSSTTPPGIIPLYADDAAGRVV